jgi:hypothetical protein
MDKAQAENINEIEQLMVSSLEPVDPRPEFVEKLHKRLTDPMSPSVRFTRRYSYQFILLVLTTLLSGMIFILAASRMIISLIREYKITRVG